MCRKLLESSIKFQLNMTLLFVVLSFEIEKWLDSLTKVVAISLLQKVERLIFTM